MYLVPLQPAIASPGKVHIQGKGVCFFQQILPGDASTTITELATYVKIHAAELGGNVHVSRLLSAVEDEHTPRIVRMPLSCIDCGDTTLSCAARASERTLRDNRLEQIKHSLKELHTQEIVWGDAKPDSILVDVNDDAYSIYFGGGYTNG